MNAILKVPYQEPFIIHIRKKKWLCGKISFLQTRECYHMVLYSPQRKEYHFYDDEIQSFIAYPAQRQIGKRRVRQRAYRIVDSILIKIYIQTNILDSPDNWCYDLFKVPNNGRIEIMYSDGIIRKMDFNGVWKNLQLHSYLLAHPVAYKIKSIRAS